MPETPDWAAPAQAPLNVYSPGCFDATEAGFSVTPTLAGVGHTVRVQALTLAFCGGVAAGLQLRGMVKCVASDNTTATQIAVVGISPGHPVDTFWFPSGGGFVTSDRSVVLAFTTGRGFGTMSVLPVLYWYEV